MGLDISLYTAAETAGNEAYDRAWDEWHAENSDGESPYDRASEEERKAWSATHSYVSSIDAPSELYPSHLFNRRYLRSSYNGSGFNNAVPDLIGTSIDAEHPNARGSLYWIFEPMGREWDGDKGTLTVDDIPKLRSCRQRAVEVKDALSRSDRLRVFTVSPNMFMPQPKTSDDEALLMYRKHVAERGEPDGWYASGQLDVFGGGVPVLAAIPGLATFNVPGVHLIYRMGEGFDSYVESAHIVAEFCDEAIGLIERDGSCRISWSG